MNAFKFGAALLSKFAVGPYQQPRPPVAPKAPQFNFSHARQTLAKHYPEYNADMTSRQVWDKTKELGTIPPNTRQLSPFQAAMKRQYRGQMPQEPVFAPPRQPQPQPQQPQNPMQFGQQVAQGRQPQGVVPGQPLPVSSAPLAPGFVRTDDGQVRSMSQDYIGMMQRDAARQQAAGPRQ